MTIYSDQLCHVWTNIEKKIFFIWRQDDVPKTSYLALLKIKCVLLPVLRYEHWTLQDPVMRNNIVQRKKCCPLYLMSFVGDQIPMLKKAGTVCPDINDQNIFLCGDPKCVHCSSPVLCLHERALLRKKLYLIWVAPAENFTIHTIIQNKATYCLYHILYTYNYNEGTNCQAYLLGAPSLDPLRDILYPQSVFRI